MTFDLISGLHMQIQTWHPPLWLCTHAKYYVKSGLTNVLKNANKTKNMHLFSIRIANYSSKWYGSKPFDTLIVFLKEFYEKVNFEKVSRRQNSMKNDLACKVDAKNMDIM